ncbi:zinc finger protein RFP-like isoform X1 [Alligator mississippiensis]|uniref:zinc finger protein RFP-like isoform X1 n=1 Tax=Alligator mississippiensis TaxID=8496 RepID=UPI0003D08A43|nr:zinc finger protein RFP-like isoform X1 [Alligator mississippiensis]
MASAIPEWDIQEETKCPICLEYFTDPVSIECGHNFCRACITQYCEQMAEGDSTPLLCPSCRTCFWKSHLRPNWDLANILEKIKQLSMKGGKGKLCLRHQKSLDLFCEEDGKAVCVVCERSPEHRSHTVLLMEEAAQKYKGQIQNLLQKRKKEKEKLLGLKLAEERKIQEYLEKRNGERQKIVSEFQQLCQLLDEQERLLLARMEELDKEVVKKQKENITKISEEFSRLGELIREMEGKCQQTASDLLQDIRSTLSRCGEGKCQQPEVTSPDLKNKLDFWCQKNTAVKEILGKVTETLLSELQKDWSRSLEKKTKPVYRKVKVTLDPDTAHPNLILSEDRRSVRRGTTRQVVAYNPERFYPIHCVLGCEVFTSGRYCWEVEVGECGSWAVGVARESVSRRREIDFNPEEGIWAVGQWGRLYFALASPRTSLPLSWFPKKIRVYLDCEGGQVSFFDADTEALILAFPPAPFTGERICPWFWLGKGSRLDLCP